jgi:hypothetical protein
VRQRPFHIFAKCQTVGMTALAWRSGDGHFCVPVLGDITASFHRYRSDFLGAGRIVKSQAREVGERALDENQPGAEAPGA